MEEAFNSSRFEIISTSTEDVKPELPTNFEESKVITREGFSKICRTCMEEAVILIPILDSSLQDDTKLSDVFFEFTSVQVNLDDTLPLNICENCLGEIVRTYNFKNRCREVEQALKVIQIKEEQTKTEVDSTENNNEIEVKEKKLSYICEVCGKSCQKKSNLKKHIRVHIKEKPIKCETCSMTFNFKSYYMRHKLIHTGERPHVCKVCNKGFTQLEHLKRHIKIHLKVNLNNHTKSTQIKNNQTYSFVCKNCGAAFKVRKCYETHLQKHEDNEDETFKKIKSPNMFPCSICEHKYKSINSLKTHMFTHQERKYLCEDCGKSFSSSESLIAHSKTHTVRDKPHKCIHCSKVFVTICALNKHILVHVDGRPHKCDVCSMAFRQSTHLRFHKLTHTDERPYSCKLCDKSFKLKTNLTVHMRRHTGETPFVCPECEKGFYDSSSLKKHRVAHHFKNKIKDNIL